MNNIRTGEIFLQKKYKSKFGIREDFGNNKITVLYHNSDLPYDYDDFYLEIVKYVKDLYNLEDAMVVINYCEDSTEVNSEHLNLEYKVFNRYMSAYANGVRFNDDFLKMLLYKSPEAKESKKQKNMDRQISSLHYT